MQSVNPDATFFATPSNIPFGSNGVVGSYGAGASYAFTIGNNKNLSNTLAYINWLYSEEAMDYTNWGIEGKTYTIGENGVRNFTADTLANYKATGLGNNCLTAMMTYDAFAAAQDSAVRANLERVLPYATLSMPKSISFTKDAQTIYDTYKVAQNAKAKEVIVKYMLGDMSIEKDWDSYVQSLYDLELQKVIDIHVAAYKRADMIE